MGGDIDYNMPVSYPGEDSSSIDHEFSHSSSSFFRDDGLSTKRDDSGHCVANSNLEPKHYRRDRDLSEILRSHEDFQDRSQGLKEAKAKILSYKPGAWIGKSGGTKSSDYDIPVTTSILLVGPKGAGKSSLVNRISRVFEDDEFASERAQVTYNSSAGEGTLFLQEYMIPRGSTSFCLYDTRSLSDDSSENAEMLERWMTRGVCNGQPVIRDSDDQSLKSRIKCNNGRVSDEIRNVNFVVFVVDGLSILKSLDSAEDVDGLYAEVFASAFKSPYVSFRDDKPLVTVTHGDLLSHFDRARIRVRLGELLGIPPTRQIFDIPDIIDQETESAIVDMLRYALEHADKNLPHKCLRNKFNKVKSPFFLLTTLMLLVVGISIIMASFPKHRAQYDLQFQEHYQKPRETGDIQGQAKPSQRDHRQGLLNSPTPQGKDETQKRRQAKFPEPKEKDDVQGLESFLKFDAKDKRRGREKLVKTLAKDETKIQWHEIRHLWLGEDA